MAVAVPKQPTVIPKQHRKNSCGSVVSTQHNDGHNKKLISEYEESVMYLSRRYKLILNAHSKNLSDKDNVSTEVSITHRVFINSIFPVYASYTGATPSPWGTCTLSPLPLGVMLKVRQIEKSSVIQHEQKQ